MALQTGSQVTHGTETYVIGQVIKSGGFGTAYHATQTFPFPRHVVVKVPGPIVQEQVWRQKFVREARILANLSHKHVVRSIAFWQFNDGEMALVQELVPGAKPLDDYLKENPDSAGSIFLQVLYGLRAIHQLNGGAVHRDLTPANILVGDDGIAKIIDFGLAVEQPRLTEILTTTGTWFGTRGFVSPEQDADPRDVDQRSDLWSFGRTFAACLQQRGPNYVQCNQLPEPWRTLCSKLTEHERGHRYQSASETIAEAVALFSQHRTRVTQFDLHHPEMKAEMPASWPNFCFVYFSERESIETLELEEAAELEPAVLQHAYFFPNAFFHRMEASPVMAKLTNGESAYEEGDAFGVLYSTLYPKLNAVEKAACFTRMIKVAIALHRYSVMDALRAVYRGEKDPGMRAELMRILDREDPLPINTIRRPSIY